ncbi:helix-turn-helix transcriptional regulator [Streptomyces sp. ET3-23]|uniref:helix-turn-helix domain-containing protein n=1 Tax=Streptomyces sp. ET3-23 TaxID=2885643 RepID=UPI001D10DCB8|nr:helix-turn-helix transcriptional regulator [Streptomyces sp. ET3-23]MCC2278679.1 helix-turn-helix transcriptional regulator [Streptomyces sp. ET3-23]
MASAGRSGQPRIGWGFFGAELKRWREAAGLTQTELGRRVFCSGSYIGQFETGIRKPQLDVAMLIDVELKTDGLFERTCRELINKSPFTDYFAEAAYLESLAKSIQSYSPTFMPGLIQTPDYARAVFLAGFPFATDEEIESWVAARLERQRILDDPTKPMLWAVLDESAIRRRVGGPAVMCGQLMRVISLVHSRRIGMQVLPFGAGAPAVGGMLKLMTFEDAPPVAYGEGAQTGYLLDDPATVARCEQDFGFLSAAALSPEASLALVREAAEEYRNAHGT